MQLKKFEKTFDSKTVIFKQGGEGSDFYILVAGSVSVLIGVKKVAEISHAGSFFGEMSPLLGKPRTATIVTNEVCRFMIIPAKAMPALINEMGMKLSKVLAERIDETTQKLVATQNEKNDLDMKCRGDYQKFQKVLACVYQQSKLPQIKSLMDYGAKMSTLATGGYAPMLDEMHLDDFLKKVVKQYKNKV